MAKKFVHNLNLFKLGFLFASDINKVCFILVVFARGSLLSSHIFCVIQLIQPKHKASSKASAILIFFF
jgi:hypothetical protein